VLTTTSGFPPDNVQHFPTAVPFPEGLTPERVSRHASSKPESLAVANGYEQMTFADLEANANQLAHHLRSFGVGPDCLIAVCLRGSAGFIVAALAILKTGGAYVCLDPDYPRDRLAFMLNDSQPLVVLTDCYAAGSLPAGKWQVLIRGNEADRVSRYSTDAPSTSCKPENLAYVIYTSGSTGTPKGVEITHRSLLNLINWHQCAFGVTDSDRATQLASVAFDASVWEIWANLAAGASVHIPKERTWRSPELYRDWLVAHRITITFVPTALAERLMMLQWPPETALRIMLTGADMLHVYPRADLPFTLVNNYGPTECTVVATSGPVLPNSDSCSLPDIGRPIMNTEILILNSQMRPMPAGEVGELYIGGLSLARGYHNRPDLTAASFVRHPFSSDVNARLYRTGDLGRYLPDGRIAFIGRRDHQLKIRGFRVEPDEITAVLNRHPAVQSSVVVGRSDKGEERHLVAYIVAALGQELVASALRSHLSKSLPEYMIPTLFLRLNSIPLTMTGKVDRSALPAPDSSNIVRTKAVTASNAVEINLSTIISDLLKLENVGCDENFFLLGGHSLLGMQLITKVRDTFDVELSLPTLFELPTIRGLASEIQRLMLESRSGVT